MKTYLILALASVGLQGTLALCKTPTANSQKISAVQTCYTQYPYLLSALHEISDRDFLDKEKSMKRISSIRNSVAKSSKKILKCVDQILSLAETEQSSADITYASLRLSEIRVLILLKKMSERNLAKK